MRSDILEILAQRRSIRAYTSDRIERATLERICTAARQAPSGANLQPGKFQVLTGNPLQALVDRLVMAQDAGEPISSEYSYFPERMSCELKDRQRRAGYALYGALGIERRDVRGRRTQFAKNYAFFGAPVGVVVTIERSMGKGCFMDLGMAIMTFLLSAEDEGLGTSGVGALASYEPIVHEHLNLPENELVVCGIAVGVPNKGARVNHFRTERCNLQEFTTFGGFEDI
jgi:nitroreductase